MRSSDWSSDVCSSDLRAGSELLLEQTCLNAWHIIRHALAGRWRQLRAFQRQQIALIRDAAGQACQVALAADHAMAGCDDREWLAAAGRADRPDRKRAVSGKRGSWRVGIGGRRNR